MQPAPSTSLAPPSIPAMRQLSEKPRQGFETRKTARKPGPSSCNFKVTLGLRATVVGNGVRETYSARYYNPNTGRFMSRDPEDGYAMNPASLHKYLYAGGDPVNMLDPTGRAELFENALIEKSFILETIPAVVSMVGRFVVLEAIPILGRIAVSTAETTAWLARVVAVFVEDALRTKLATGILKLYVCAELGMAFADASIDINSANVPAADKSEYGRLIDAAMIGVCAAVY